MQDQPLSGHQVVLTRSREQNVGLGAAIRALGGEVLLLPTLRYAPVTPSPEECDALTRMRCSHILFTSQNGVPFFCGLSKQLHISFDRWQGCCIAAVGPKTAATAHEYGLPPDFVAREARGESLVRELAAACQFEAESSVLVPQSTLARPETIAALDAVGVTATPLVVYETATESPKASEKFHQAIASGKTPDTILFASPSAVDGFLTLTDKHGETFLGNPKVRVVTIGPTTTQAVEQKGYTVHKQAREPSIDGLAAACAQAWLR